MRVGVVGINHKLADLQLRELLATTCHRRFGPGSAAHGDHSFILLSTCNRTEIYFSSEDLTATHSYLLGIFRQDVEEEFDQKLYSYFGQDCFYHLCRVAAGLDSAIVAETEIQGQVKAAYEAAFEFQPLPSEMHYLFQKSLSISKKVRTEFPLKPGLPDIEHAILSTGQHLFKTPGITKILFVGASEINKKILGFLASKNLYNITLCNRSHENGKVIADKHNIALIDWDAVSHWHLFDWVIFGTKSPRHLITNQEASKVVSHKLIIDLSVPRNVEPDLARNPMITLLNIDQINRRLKIRKTKMACALSRAEGVIERAVDQQMNLYQTRERNRLNLVAVSA